MQPVFVHSLIWNEAFSLRVASIKILPSSSKIFAPPAVAGARAANIQTLGCVHSLH